MEFLFGIVVGVFVTYTFIMPNPTYHAKAVELNDKAKALFKRLTEKLSKD